MTSNLRRALTVAWLTKRVLKRLTSVAEAVEDGQTLGLLEEAGWDFAQGYFISRPVPGEAVRPWLRRYADDAGA
jgi:EAL domain-containing protein (putative c-di-GMP-specific phosphodiesterase class I)